MLKENIIFGIGLGVALALLVALGAEIIERMYSACLIFLEVLYPSRINIIR